MAERTQEGGTAAGARARFEAHLRTASTYRRGAARNAQGVARAQERGHHESLQRARIGGTDTRGERGAEDAGIDVVASGDEAIPRWSTGRSRAKVAQSEKRARSFAPNPLI